MRTSACTRGDGRHDMGRHVARIAVSESFRQRGAHPKVTIAALFFFFSSRRRHTRFDCDWSSDVCSSDLGLKNLLKEETLPAQADKLLFLLAPAMSFVPALLTFAVIPFATPLPTPWGDVDMVVANLPVGFLYILAFGSLGVYGIVLAGWASN